MNGPSLLDEHKGILRTGVGACWPGSRAVFRGHDLHADLQEMDWVGLYLFGVTGRRFSPQQIELLHSLWTYTSYPDARLWNNRVAALAGTARSSGNLGTAAALAVSEAKVYGGQAGMRALDFLLRMQQKVAQGEDIEQLVRNELEQRRIYGYGRPINSIDERIPWMMERVRRLGFDQGVHLKIAFAIEGILLPLNPLLRMNYAALHAALIADMGISVKEYQLLRIPTFLAGMPPCYLEARDKPEGAIFPIPCNEIDYVGVSQRAWNKREKVQVGSSK